MLYDLNSIKSASKSCISIGNFDGVHLGHRKVLKSCVEKAKEMKIKSIAITLFPHPRLILKPKEFFFLLPLKDKIKRIRDLGIDDVIILDFLKVKDIPPKDFIFALRNLNPVEIFVGEDFKFGKSAEGKAEDMKILEKFGIRVNIVELMRRSQEKISSSHIRKLIKSGEVEKVKDFMGEYYFVLGGVVKGEGIGRKIGFPTANVKTTFELPKEGVYACKVEIEGEWIGVANIGPKPTFEDIRKTFEVHIINFNKDIYLKPIKIHFVKRIRDVIKFNSIHELKERIKKDIEFAKRIPNLNDTMIL